MKKIGASGKKNAQTVRRSGNTEDGRRGRLDKKQKHALLLIAGLVLLLAAVTFATVSLGIGEGNSRAVSAPVDGIQGTKVVLDAGHGGADAGTIGTTAGTQEAGINLEIALRLQKELENSGVQGVMTRSDEKAVAETKDLDMQKRREIISTSGQDVYKRQCIYEASHQKIRLPRNVTQIHFDDSAEGFGQREFRRPQTDLLPSGQRFQHCCG